MSVGIDPPEVTPEDIQNFRNRQRVPVGPWRTGVVVEHLPSLNNGLVREDATGETFVLARDLVGSKLFDTLSVNVQVRFRKNSRRGCAVIEKI